MSIFDAYQSAMISTTQKVFGDLAVWCPSDHGDTRQGLVFYKCPTDAIVVGSDKVEYRPYNYSIEYFEGQFLGLKDAVDLGQTERVEVKGTTLAIRQVVLNSDGKTLIAYGEKSEPND